MVRVFTNGPRDLRSIPGQVIPKTLKIALDASLLNTQHYKGRVKWRIPGKGVVPSPTPWCSSYRKGSLRVTLDYGRQLYFISLKNDFWCKFLCCAILILENSVVVLGNTKVNFWKLIFISYKKQNKSGDRPHFWCQGIRCTRFSLTHSWMGFDPSFERPTCLATLKSCDTTKQSVCGWQYIIYYLLILYIYNIIYIHI